jgi:hypothetical protein
MREEGPLRRVVEGALAGAAATWVLDKVTSALYERESNAVRERENRARGGTAAFEVAAQKLAHLGGRQLGTQQRQRYGQAIHWGRGAAAGAAYALLRERLPASPLARALLFGTAFWLAADELANPLLGLTPGPGAFPWQTHARGLAGHLAYGAIADAAYSTLERVA